MRRINWNKLPPNKVKNTIWENVNEGQWQDRLDFKQLQLEFGVKKRAVGGEEDGDAGDPAETPVAPARKLGVSLIDAKKAHNISILLGRLKMDFEDITQALWRMEGDKFTEQTVVQFLKFAPEKEEKQRLEEFIKGGGSPVCARTHACLAVRSRAIASRR